MAVSGTMDTGTAPAAPVEHRHYVARRDVGPVSVVVLALAWAVVWLVVRPAGPVGSVVGQWLGAEAVLLMSLGLVLISSLPRVAALDLGLTNYAAAVYSDGTREKIPNPQHLRAAQRRLRRAQRGLSRKRGPDRRTRRAPSANWRAQQVKVARAHAQVRHRRTDFQHKLAHRLVRENQAVVLEGLNVLGLTRSGGHNAQGRGLRRGPGDAAWGTFTRLLGEKVWAFPGWPDMGLCGLVAADGVLLTVAVFPLDRGQVAQCRVPRLLWGSRGRVRRESLME